MPMWCLVLMWCQVPIIYHTPHWLPLWYILPMWWLIHSDIMPYLMPHSQWYHTPFDVSFTVISCPIWCLMPMWYHAPFDDSCPCFFFLVEKGLNFFTVIIKSLTAMDYCQSKCIWLCIVFFNFWELKDLVWTWEFLDINVSKTK